MFCNQAKVVPQYALTARASRIRFYIDALHKALFFAWVAACFCWVTVTTLEHSNRRMLRETSLLCVELCRHHDTLVTLLCNKWKNIWGEVAWFCSNPDLHVVIGSFLWVIKMNYKMVRIMSVFLVDIETEDRHRCCLGFIIVYGSRRPEGLVNTTDSVWWQEKFIITGFIPCNFPFPLVCFVYVGTAPELPEGQWRLLRAWWVEVQRTLQYLHKVLSSSFKYVLLGMLFW